jgi:hypothetical protein
MKVKILFISYDLDLPIIERIIICRLYHLGLLYFRKSGMHLMIWMIQKIC